MARPFGLARGAVALALGQLLLGCARHSKLNSVALGYFMKRVGANLAAPPKKLPGTDSDNHVMQVLRHVEPLRETRRRRGIHRRITCVGAWFNHFAAGTTAVVAFRFFVIVSPREHPPSISRDVNVLPNTFSREA